MRRYLDRYGVDLGLLVVRLGFGGFLALNHGLAKLTSWPAKHETFADPLHIGHAPSLALAIFGEFFCGLAVALGFRVRITAIPALITMLVAVFITHEGAVLGDGEHAMLYAFAFVAVILAGAGRFSVDGLLASRRGSRSRTP